MPQPVVNQFQPGIALLVIQGVLRRREQPGKVNLIADIRQNRAGFLGVGFQPRLQGWTDRDEPPRGRLRFVPADLNLKTMGSRHEDHGVMKTMGSRLET